MLHLAAILSLFSLSVTAADTVTVGQLTHRVPPAAAKEYFASLDAKKAGNLEESIHHSRAALEADPANAGAHNELGLLYLATGRLLQALAEFDRASQLDQDLEAARVNASYVLLALDRPAEAEAAARAAIAKNHPSKKAFLMLGWSLAAQNRYTEEALTSLLRAAPAYPEAHLGIGDVLIHQGSFSEARRHLRAYLSKADGSQRAVAESWLRLLAID